jgi:chromo domain-containing protein 1
MSAQDHIAEMPVGKFLHNGGHRTAGGYFWNSGEALAHVFFGPEKDFVGVVRICGMGDTLKYDLLSSKSKGHGKKLEMWFKEVYTKGEYDKLCDQV